MYEYKLTRDSFKQLKEDRDLFMKLSKEKSFGILCDVNANTGVVKAKFLDSKNAVKLIRFVRKQGWIA